jgi:sialate O-acetylesterase
MVLQQQKKVRVWGWGAPCSLVTVKLGSWVRKVQVSKSGLWLAYFLPHKAGTKVDLLVRGSNQEKRTGLLFGEVWLCSGQSNMSWPVVLTKHKKEDLKRPADSMLRLFQVRRQTAYVPQKNVYGRWIIASPSSLRTFSAVCYHFGLRLREVLKVPVGLIQSDWGGTPAESWTPVSAQKANPALQPMLQRWETRVRLYNAAKALRLYKRRAAMWKLIAARRKKKRLPLPPKPRSPIPPRYHAHRPGNLYNSMIHPLRHMSLAGFVWYQGESNVARAWNYRTLFATLIRSWRKRWALGPLPFYFVQLAPYKYRWTRGVELAELREAQLVTYRKLKNTGLVVTLDIGDLKDIHPRDKRTVGRRLARWALSGTYKRKLVPSGPLYRSFVRKGKALHLEFDFADKGLKSCDGKPLLHIVVAGKDRKFVSAKARIQGKTLIVFHPSLVEPHAVRYGWKDDALPNLCNQEGLPASSFRTDTWPGVTDKRR